MSQKVREEMLPRLRQRYAGRGKQGRGVMLDVTSGKMPLSQPQRRSLMEVLRKAPDTRGRQNVNSPGILLPGEAAQARYVGHAAIGAL